VPAGCSRIRIVARLSALVEKPPFPITPHVVAEVHAMPAGSSIMLSSAPARVRVKTRFAGPRGRTTRSSTAAVRARSCARRIVRSPAPSRKVSPRRSKRTCFGRGGRKTPSRASSTRPTPAMSNSPLSDKCEVDPRSTTATRKWPANGTTDSTLSPLPEPQPRAEGAKRTLGLALLSTLLRSRSPRHAVSSKQAGTSANRKPCEGASEAGSAPAVGDWAVGAGT
jgi:hypothetical protein